MHMDNIWNIKNMSTHIFIFSHQLYELNHYFYFIIPNTRKDGNGILVCFFFPFSILSFFLTIFYSLFFNSEVKKIIVQSRGLKMYDLAFGDLIIF